MGLQQLLLVLLGVLLVGIAISVAVSLFTGLNIQSSKHALVTDLSNIAGYAREFRMKPTSMNGGGGSYAGFVIPVPLRRTENGSYTATTTATTVTFTATAAESPTNTITAVLSSGGTLGSWTFTGDFQ